MLELIGVRTNYGTTRILHGISLAVKEGQVVGLLGRNGMGKTTTFRSIIGFTPPESGTIRFKGRDIAGMKSYQIARIGIGLVPDGRQIFRSLSVEENLTMSARTRGKADAWSLDRVFCLFPVLKERARLKGTFLSGGEQQMLCIGRALMTNPDLILMDEPLEGLSPLYVGTINDTINRLKESGLSILLIEQNIPAVLACADAVYLMNKGEIVYHGTAAEFRDNEEVKAKHLGVAG